MAVQLLSGTGEAAKIVRSHLKPVRQKGFRCSACIGLNCFVCIDVGTPRAADLMRQLIRMRFLMPPKLCICPVQRA